MYDSEEKKRDSFNEEFRKGKSLEDGLAGRMDMGRRPEKSEQRMTNWNKESRGIHDAST